MKKAFFLLLILLAAQNVHASSAGPVTVTGKVDDSSGLGVIGAYITEVGTKNHAVTDLDGNYSITVPADAVLEFVSMGYVTVREPVDGRTRIDVLISDDSVMLEETVVVGYGVQKKESVVGAISQVSGETLVNSGNANITNALAGKLSGVTTIQTSGQPGNSDSEIVIRGVSSFGSNKPLVLVDGVERDFASIDPNEVQSISVLKDASATAVFGAKGANGVIIVTTKAGAEGKPRMEISFSEGLSNPINTAIHVDSYSTMKLLNVAKMNDQQFNNLSSEETLRQYADPSSRVNSLIYPDIDWLREMTNTFAPTTNANFSVSGGTKKVRYFASLGYTYEGSIFKGFSDGKVDTNYKYHRFNFRTNIDFNITQTTRLSFRLGGNVGVQNKPTVQGGDEAMWMYIFGSSTAKYPMYYPSWVMEDIPDPDYPDAASGDRLISEADQSTKNPYYQIMRGQFTQMTDTKIFTDLAFDQNLDFITRGLSFQAKVSLSTYFRYQTLSTDYYRATWYLDFNKLGTGLNPWNLSNDEGYIFVENPIYTTAGNTLQSGYYTDLYYDMSLNYKRTFGNHSVTGLFLLNRQEQDKGAAFPYYNEALVGRATYDYAHKYLVEFNMGYTGSERFASGNRFGFFPSGALGWVVSEEKFFQPLKPVFSKLKLRFSAGLVGNDYAANRWLYISQYSTNSAGYIEEDRAANTAAQWEQALKMDGGIEMGFFNGDLTFGVDLFKEDRTKMLISVSNNTPIWVGNVSKELNKGAIKKHGLEVEAAYSRKLNAYWRINFGGNFSYNENRILYYDDAPYAISYQRKVGAAIGAQTSGLYTTSGKYLSSIDDIHSSVLPVSMSSLVVGDYSYLDYNSDGTISTLDLARMEGSLYPPIGYSFNLGFSWKDLSVSALFQGYAGKYTVYDSVYEWEFFKGNYETHVGSLDYWSPANPDGTHEAVHYQSLTLPNHGWSGSSEASATNSGYGGKIMGATWRNSDYLRLKEASLSYNLHSTAIKNATGIENVRFYVTGGNLLTFTDLIEGDPESKHLIWGAYPMMRTVKFGFQVTF